MKGKEKGKKKEKGKGRWKEDSLRKVGRTDAHTDTQMILYSGQCYALHWTDNNKNMLPTANIFCSHNIVFAFFTTLPIRGVQFCPWFSFRFGSAKKNSYQCSYQFCVKNQWFSVQFSIARKPNPANMYNSFDCRITNLGYRAVLTANFT